MHYGEWWGQGIQRGYGLTEKRLSLFNVAKASAYLDDVPGLGVVPVLYRGPFFTIEVSAWLATLQREGSVAAPGFMRPEGVCVWHSAARQVFKALIENDDVPKGATE